MNESFHSFVHLIRYVQFHISTKEIIEMRGSRTKDVILWVRRTESGGRDFWDQEQGEQRT